MSLPVDAEILLEYFRSHEKFKRYDNIRCIRGHDTINVVSFKFYQKGYQYYKRIYYDLQSGTFIVFGGGRAIQFDITNPDCLDQIYNALHPVLMVDL